MSAKESWPPAARFWNELVEEVIEEWTAPRDGLIAYVADALDADGYLPLQEPVTVKQLLDLGEEDARKLLVAEMAKQRLEDPVTGDKSLPPDLMKLTTDYMAARNDGYEEVAAETPPEGY